jgi:hypothetical protein
MIRVRVAYGWLLGLRITPWWFLSIVELTCYPRERLQRRDDWPPDDGPLRVASIHWPRLELRPTQRIRDRLSAKRKAVGL